VSFSVRCSHKKLRKTEHGVIILSRRTGCILMAVIMSNAFSIIRRALDHLQINILRLVVLCSNGYKKPALGANPTLPLNTNRN
jgi:lysophospholipid acyltransferase (LPLAT)-like uncharacterized protein